MWKSKFKFISIVKPKYLIFMHCGIEILFKKTLVCGKSLFSLGGMIRKFPSFRLTRVLSIRTFTYQIPSIVRYHIDIPFSVIPFLHHFISW